MPTGWIITVFILLPNLLFLVFPPKNVPPEMNVPEQSRKKRLEIIEKIGQAGCFALPFFFSIHTTTLFDRVSLALFGLALILYYAGWLRYLLQGRRFYFLFAPMVGIPLPMAVAPIMAFIVAAGCLHAWQLAIAGVLLAAGHIPVSWWNGSAAWWKKC